MENKFQTSFIPKTSMSDGGKVKVKTPINILSLVSTIITTLTVLTALAVLGYTFLLDRQIKTAREELNKMEREFDYAGVGEIVRVDNKLKAATNLLSSHTAMSGVFNFLEENTLKNLRFTDFKYTFVSPTRISISMKGQARTFEAVARQEELFTSVAGQKAITEPLFSNLDLDNNGTVTFSFLASVDPSVISYENNISTAPLRTAPLVSPAAASSTRGTSTNPTIR